MGILFALCSKYLLSIHTLIYHLTFILGYLLVGVAISNFRSSLYTMKWISSAGASMVILLHYVSATFWGCGLMSALSWFFMCSGGGTFKNNPRLQAGINNLSSYTIGIYLIHCIFTNFFQITAETIAEITGQNLVLFTTSSVAFLLSLFTAIILKRVTPWLVGGRG